MNNKSSIIFSILLIVLIIFLIFRFLTNECKLRDREQYFYFERKEDMGFIITEDYLRKILSLKEQQIVHLYLKNYGYRHVGKDKYVPFMFEDGSFLSLGIIRDIVVRSPKYYDIESAQVTAGKSAKNSVKIDGEKVGIFSLECNKGILLLLNFKEKKIEVLNTINRVDFDLEKGTP